MRSSFSAYLILIYLNIQITLGEISKQWSFSLRNEEENVGRKWRMTMNNGDEKPSNKSDIEC
jgi:hypothetical protein